MKFKTLLTINSALAFVSGIACVLMPAQLLASYDLSLAPIGLVIYQFWGAALIGLGMFTWFARGVRESALQRRFAMALFITNGLSCVMAVRGQFAGRLKSKNENASAREESMWSTINCQDRKRRLAYD